MIKNSKLKKLFTWLFVIAGIFGLTIVGNAQDEAGKIIVSKTATKIYDEKSDDNLEKGRYAKVNLSVNANPYNTSVVTNGKLDIVLIFDSSNSMATKSGRFSTTTRMQDAKQAAKDFANTLMDNKGTVKIGIVEFGTQVMDVQEMTDSKTTVTRFINNKLNIPRDNQDGGTNLQAAIARAKTVLNNGKREDAKQIVIILTDGVPTFFNYNGTRYGTGQDDSEVNYNCRLQRRDYICDSQRPSDAAKTELDNLKTTHKTSDVYTIVFGNEKEATEKLAKINPENKDPLYKNYNALTGDDLKKMFEDISEQLMNIIGKNSVVTDIIPKEFKLTTDSKQSLIEQGVEVVENNDGTTTLIWNIGNVEANNIKELTYEVKAEDDYHGSIYTNQSATLKTTVAEDNPYYDKISQEITFEKPTVEIPAITKDDHYSENPSYIGYASSTITGTSILNNDLNKEIKTDKTKANDTVVVKDEIIINETSTVVKVVGETNKYQITKDGVLQGGLTVNEDGTFTFNATNEASGEVEFTYHIKSTINTHHETEFVYSNDAKVTLLIKSRQKTSISGVKVWHDANNNDGIRPTTITVKLLANNQEIASQEVSASTNWTYEFTDLYVYEEGHENEEDYLIDYTVKELNVPGYRTEITGTTITNTHEIDTSVEVSVRKVWDDASNQDGLRKEITVALLANGKEVETITLSDTNNWTYTFNNLQKYEDGKEIKYTIEEKTTLDGYTVEITGSVKEGYTITNTHTPVTIDITGEKVWLDNNNNDNTRPESITLKLLANGKVIKTTTVTNKTATTPNNWTYEFKDLPKFENGKEIIYTVEEVPVENYETSYDEENPFIIINTHENEQLELSGEKTWDDANNQDGIRPNSIKVTLIGKVGDKTIYTSEKIEVTATTNWKYNFGKVNKYYEGQEITYTVIEDNVEGYNVEYNGLDITNTHTPETLDIAGTKVWNDSDNQDGIRPEEITVILNKTVAGVTTKVTETVVKEGASGNWNFKFENLPKYENGEEIIYTVEEVDVNGYTSEIKDFTITNTHTPETVTFNIQKEWYDEENNDGIRPESITVRIKANGEEILTAILSEKTNWQATFKDLPKYTNGQEIIYEIVEDAVDGYTPTVTDPIKETDNNITIVIRNTHELETTEILIEKVWDDLGNENSRPNSITVNIYANGKLFEIVEITKENNWTYTLDGLQKYLNGEEIIYTVEEVELEDYVTSYDGYTIINSYKSKGEIIPPYTGTSSNTNNLYREMLVLILGALSITYVFKKKEN